MHAATATAPRTHHVECARMDRPHRLSAGPARQYAAGARAGGTRRADRTGDGAGRSGAAGATVTVRALSTNDVRAVITGDSRYR